MKRKMVAALLTAVMTFAMSATAFAATAPITQDTSDPKTRSTTVSYEVKETYTVTIPETVTFTKGESGVDAQTNQIKASDLMIGFNKTLDVTVSSDNYEAGAGESASGSFRMKGSDGTSFLKYKINKTSAMGDEVTNGASVLSVASGTTEDQTVDLWYTFNDIPTKAGTYTDTLTFTVALK